jgi:hypothetical protein
MHKLMIGGVAGLALLGMVPTAPWTVEQIPGGFKVLDANGQSLAYVYGRKTKAD